MCKTGAGVPQDYAEAMKWFRRAAKQGDALQQHIFGMRSAVGQGVPQNLWEAHVWFSLAADNGHEEAVEMRDHIAGLLSFDDLDSAQAEVDRIHAMIQDGLDD